MPFKYILKRKLQKYRYLRVYLIPVLKKTYSGKLSAKLLINFKCGLIECIPNLKMFSTHP